MGGFYVYVAKPPTLSTNFHKSNRISDKVSVAIAQPIRMCWSVEKGGLFI